MAQLTLEKVSKWYGETCVVHELSLAVADGSLVVLVGPSGCGKSTLLRMIAGLTPVSHGEILIDRQPVTTLPPRDRDIAMVFQDYALYPHMTVFDNLAFALKMRKLPKKEITVRVEETASALGLTSLLRRRSRELSGGQQQRVALGRALVRDPKLFLFDEPLSNLDAKLRVEMRAELIRLHRRLAATMLFVTHDQAEAMSLGEKLVVMRDGRIQQVGPPLEVYQEPANLFVAGFLGVPAMNTLPCRLEETPAGPLLVNQDLRLPLAPARAKQLAPRLAPDRRLILGLRPEQLHLAGPTAAEPEPAATATMEVEFVESLGSELLVTCRRGALSLVARLSPDIKVRPGQRLHLAFELSRAVFFDPGSERRLA